MINLDLIDQQILASLQKDASRPILELASDVSLSGPACWKRIQRLRRDKVILRDVTLCDETKLGRSTMVFVFITARQHDEGWVKQFAAAVGQLSEVVSAYRLSGDVDYLLHVLVEDIAGYDRFYHRLIRLVDLSDVSSSFVMEKLKYSTGVPIGD